MDLSGIVRKRGGLRAVFSRKIVEFGTETEGSDAWYAVGDTIVDYFRKIEALDEQVQNLIESDTDLETEIQTCADYGQKMHLISRKMKNVSNGDVSVLNTSSTGHVSPAQVRLPKLSLPKFDGSVLSFTGFFELFESSVDTNTSLSEVQKFSYLRGCLTGEASRSIEGLALTGANYAEAIGILKKRYGSNYKIISAHVNELLRIPTVSSVKGNSLRSFCDKIQVHVRALEVLGVASEEYSCFLVQIVLSRLPNYLKLHWARRDEEDPQVDALLDFLTVEAKAQEASFDESERSGFRGRVPHNVLSTSSNENQIRNSYENNRNRYNNERRRRFSGSFELKCVLCSQSHYLSKCPKFLSMKVNERQKFLFEKHLCFRCFANHRISTCPKNFQCTECKSLAHNSLLHGAEFVRGGGNKFNELGVTSISVSSRFSLLPTLSVIVRGPNCSMKLRFLLDSGSQATLIRRDKARLLGLKSTSKCNINIRGYDGKTSIIRNSSIVDLQLDDPTSSSPLILKAIESDNLSIRVSTGDFHAYVEQYNLSEIVLADKYDQDVLEVDGIIGADQFFDVATGVVKDYGPNVKAMETKFGYCLCGSSGQSTSLSSNFISVENDLKFLWEMEKIGFESNAENPLKNNVVENFESSINQQPSGRYEVSWPRKLPTPNLKSYEDKARCRLNAQWHRLKKDRELLGECDDIFESYQKDNIIEEVPEEEITSPVFPVRYLPHHPVVKLAPKRKIRVVFDASAKDENGVSLNDSLEEGPNLNPELLQVLLRVRLMKFVVSCDIEAAFLQIGLKLPDRDLVRFMWYKNQGNGRRRLVHFRFTRVIFGATSSPFLLAATLRHHIELYRKKHPDKIDLIKNSFYVDDFLCSFDQENECLEIFEILESMFHDMKASLGKWKSNSNYMKMKHDIKTTAEEKFLGICWNPAEDALFVRVKSLPSPVTKRQLLRCIASIYDPFGIVAPYVMVGKLIIKRLWQMGNKWDGDIGEDVLKDIEKWWSANERIETIRIPRWLGYCGEESIELVGFCDASNDGYGMVVYVRVSGSLNFLMAKSRVAPMKKVSTPRLELTAAFLLAKMMNYVASSYNSKVFISCYSDSQVALAWIKGNASKWETFVANRVNEIQRLTPPEVWAFVPGSINPADLASRGTCDFNKLSSDYWLQGPNIPKIDVSQPSPLVIASVVSEEKEKESIEKIDSWISNISSYGRVLRVMGWVKRFIQNLKSSVRHQQINNDSSLSSNELEQSLISLIQITQRSTFLNEIQTLKSQNCVCRKSPLTSLQPFIDNDSIIRRNTRLKNSSLSHDEIYPIILHHSSPLTKLLIDCMHRENFHCGVNDVMMKLRNKYWITKFRQTVRGVIFSCNHCRKLKSKNLNPPFGQLPPERCREFDFVPFSSCGLDYVGPFKTKTKDKMYVLLFTCARVRAVHFEICKSMNIASFLECFDMFCARRGVPKFIISDNFKTFKLAAEILKNRHMIKWKFNTPRAPWEGGFFERLVKSMKKPLKSCCAEIYKSIEAFRHCITKIEFLINSRPLTVIDSSFDEIVHLSPNDFLLYRGVFLSNETNVKASDLSKIYVNSLRGYKILWNRWRTEYLRMLKIANKKSNNKNVSVNDVVILHEGPKYAFQIARVIEVYSGDDGITRRVKLMLPNRKMLTRPVKLLSLLEFEI